MVNRPIQLARKKPKASFLREIARNHPYYLMILPAAAIYFLLAYLPLPGLLMAFKEFKVSDMLYGLNSRWSQPLLKHFTYYFKSVYFLRTTLNTLWINFNYLVWTTLFNVGFAIMLNEIRSKFAVRVYQNAMFLPYFFSAIIISQVVDIIILSTNYGLANQILTLLGMQSVDWVNTPGPWVAIIVLTKLWQTTGYGVIIYLATIAGIDEELYEAAALDGAGRWAKIRRITLPMLLPAIIMLSLLSIGQMFFGDFSMIYALTTPGANANNTMLFSTTDVIETYIFRAVRQNFDFSTTTAIGMYQSIVGFILVFGSNKLVKLYDKDYALF